MQKGCENMGQRKAAFPLREPPGLAQSRCPPCHTHIIPGQGRQVQAGTLPSPASLTALPWEESSS